MPSRYKKFLSCTTACERLVILVLLMYLQQQQSCQNMGFAVAWSIGAGNCDSIDDSIRGVGKLGILPHNIPILTQSGELSKFGIKLFINNTEVIPTNTFRLKRGKSYSLSLNSTRAFKGILLRLEASTNQDLIGTLTEADTKVLRPQGSCAAPVVGLTHLNAQEKNEVKATIDTDGLRSGNLTLDVTIVLNIGLIPRWAHTRFIFPLLAV